MHTAEESSKRATVTPGSREGKTPLRFTPWYEIIVALQDLVGPHTGRCTRGIHCGAPPAVPASHHARDSQNASVTGVRMAETLWQLPTPVLLEEQRQSSPEELRGQHESATGW
jgi:hypothetical protein